MPSIVPFPIDRPRFPQLLLLSPASLRNKPEQSPNSACGFRLYYFLQTYSRFQQGSEVSFPDNKPLQAEKDDTFYNSLLSLLELEYTWFLYLTPVLQVLCRKHRLILPMSQVFLYQDSAAVQAYFSYLHACYTMLSASPLLPDKFCKECFFLSQFFSILPVPAQSTGIKTPFYTQKKPLSPNSYCRDKSLLSDLLRCHPT